MLRSQGGAQSNGKSIGTLIISPTRELAMQIDTEAKQLTRFTNFRTLVSRCPAAV